MTLAMNQSAQPALTSQNLSLVCQYPAASADAVISWFSQRLQFETDCSDVHSALDSNADDFVLLDVRGEAAYAKSHVPGALNLPHRQISPATLQALPPQRLLVVYCAGPHCNGADQAALKIARLGYPVKMMIGGLQGYQDEGFPLATGPVNPNTSAQCGC
ncbi:MAG: rhodanese-like domain-containing protein [Rheinheimera sp.]|nr:rhodanese-like domain-containing protein [Rheinheimera sp.]